MQETQGVIVKEVNKKYNNESCMKNVVRYIWGEKGKHKDEYIPRGGCYVSYDTAEEAIQSFVDTQVYFGKNNKKRLRHWIISFPNRVHNIEKIIKIAKSVAKTFFKDYESVFAIHDGVEGVHIHLVYNPVNFRNGKKWHKNQKEFCELRREIMNFCNKRIESI